jgi:hypothetical protein
MNGVDPIKSGSWKAETELRAWTELTAGWQEQEMEDGSWEMADFLLDINTHL